MRILGILLSVIFCTISIGNPDIFAQKYLLPLQQMRNGVPIEDITCSTTDGKPLLLFLRIENHDPVCVTADTADTLSRRGWIENNQTVYNQIVIDKAKEFALSSPTFINYGDKKTLEASLTTCDLLVPQSCYPNVYFKITKTGSYGNGSGTMPIETQTVYHVMAMSIYDINQVQCAVVDGIWDEKNQKPLDKNDAICGHLFGYKG